MAPPYAEFQCTCIPTSLITPITFLLHTLQFFATIIIIMTSQVSQHAIFIFLTAWFVSSRHIHVNRPASGGTVPHFDQMSRGPAKSADVPHFSKMVLLFFSLPIILHVCLATQQSDELRIKIGSKFARRQATDYK